MIETFYRQCELSKGTQRQTSWIPEPFAVEGQYVRLIDDDGWKVDSVSVARRDETYVRSHERDHMHHRSRTDI